MISAITGDNALLDPRRVPRPRFPNITQLSIVRSQGPPRRLLVSKRDIRHFYHQLRATSKWRPHLGHVIPRRVRPSLRRVLRPGKIPAHCAWPMGHTLSSTLAQGVMDVCAEDAGLPGRRRIRHGDLPPLDLPVFGLCMDDGWIVEEEGGDVDGAAMMADLSDAWRKVGLEENLAKRVERQAGEEVQGFFVHPVKHWVGLSVPKRLSLWGGGLLVMSMQRPARHCLERWLGKMGYAMAARTCTRSVFDDFYSVLDQARRDSALVFNGLCICSMKR